MIKEQVILESGNLATSGGVELTTEVTINNEEVVHEREGVDSKIW